MIHVLVILKYIPSRDTELKSDCLWTIIDGLSAQGVRITLATKGKSAPHEFPQVDHKALLRYLDNPQEAANPFPAGTPDVSLAVCTSEYPAILAHRLFQKLGIPFVVQEHRTVYDRQYLTLADLPAALLLAMRDAAVVGAVSSPLAHTMQMRGIRNDISVLPNSLPTRFFQKPAPLDDDGRLSDFLAWSADHFVFGAWTNWRTFKRVDLLIEAFRLFHAETGGGRLIIAGPLEEPWTEDRVREFLESHHLQENVYLFGVASRDEIHAITHRIDCCVVPSDFETFGLPVLEALAAGKPVVATRCGGPEDLISEHTLGVLVEKDSPKKLAKALSFVHRNRSRYDPEMLSNNAFQRFSSEAVSGKILKALRTASSESASRYEKEVAKFILLQRTNILPAEEKRKTKQDSPKGPRRVSRDEIISDYVNRNYKKVIRQYLETMKAEYLELKPFLPKVAQNILDVGCGMAGLDHYLFRHFDSAGAKLFLLDRSETSDAIWYGYERKGAFYNSLSTASNFLQARGVDPRRITTIDAPDDGLLSEDLPPLDLVVSTLSWGFHYPVSTYLDSVYERMSQNGCLILDTRKDTEGEELLQRKFGKENVSKIREKGKHITLRCIKVHPGS
ncbi:MAG: glycosyltransferase [Pararhodobacter sp.]|nr:glycosyltransferase [Pararhodobacter sp.]